MIQLKKYIILVLTVLLLSSTSWCQNNITNKSCDSVIISVNAIRIANAKMIELNYEKEININLQKTIETDSIIISSLENNIFQLKKETKENINKIERQRNKAVIIGSTTSLTMLILLIVLL